jgi:hypothetical protein
MVSRWSSLAALRRNNTCLGLRNNRRHSPETVCGETGHAGCEATLGRGVRKLDINAALSMARSKSRARL